MRKALVVALAVLACGCSARLQVNAGNQPEAPGASSITGGPSGLRIQAGSNSFAAAIIAISLLAGAIEHAREPRPFPSPSALIPEAPAPAPGLAPERRVNEQDCTKPVADWSANLKCR